MLLLDCCCCCGCIVFFPLFVSLPRVIDVPRPSFPPLLSFYLLSILFASVHNIIFLFFTSSIFYPTFQHSLLPFSYFLTSLLLFSPFFIPLFKSSSFAFHFRHFPLFLHLTLSISPFFSSSIIHFSFFTISLILPLSSLLPLSPHNLQTTLFTFAFPAISALFFTFSLRIPLLSLFLTY